MNGQTYVSFIIVTILICLVSIPAQVQSKPTVPLPTQQLVAGVVPTLSPAEAAPVPATGKTGVAVCIAITIMGFAIAVCAMAFLLIVRRRTSKQSNGKVSPLPDTRTCAGSQPRSIGKKSYIGQWEGEGVSLEISWQGNASREYIGNDKFESQHGIILFSGNNFSICDTTLHNCSVQIPPHKKGNRWQMTIDGITLYKIDDCFRWLKGIGKENYEGYWVCEGMAVEIYATGDATAIIFSGQDSSRIAGRIKFTADGFVVGNASVMQKFEVRQAPIEHNNQWTMIVNGSVLQRIKNHGYVSQPANMSSALAAIADTRNGL